MNKFIRYAILVQIDKLQSRFQNNLGYIIDLHQVNPESILTQHLFQKGFQMKRPFTFETGRLEGPNRF